MQWNNSCSSFAFLTFELPCIDLLKGHVSSFSEFAIEARFIDVMMFNWKVLDHLYSNLVCFVFLLQKIKLIKVKYHKKHTKSKIILFWNTNRLFRQRQFKENKNEIKIYSELKQISMNPEKRAAWILRHLSKQGNFYST